MCNTILERSGSVSEEHLSRRVAVTLSEQTLDILDKLEEQFGWTKSQAISVALVHYNPPSHLIQPKQEEEKHDNL